MMTKYGWLIDLDKCTGCRACQVACKRWNDLPAEVTEFNDKWTNPKDLSPTTWTHMDFLELDNNSQDYGFEWVFVKRQCWHCDNPACLDSCPVDAIQKYDEGPVVIDQSKCTGCKYCVDACPFGIPRYDSQTDKVYKCNFCFDRIANDLLPACIKSCTTGAMEFGDIETIRAKASAMGASPKATALVYTMPTFRNGDQPTEGDLALGDQPSAKPTWQVRSLVNNIGLLGTALSLIGGFVYVIKHRSRSVKEKEGGN
jgi:formate dehydrogenase iron-sulfur subunit